MKTIRVNLKERSYDIHTGHHILGTLTDFLLREFPKSKIIVLTNKKIARLHKSKLDHALKGIDTSWIYMADGEQHKNSKTLNTIYEELSKKRINRKDILIAFGGGVIGDMGGFAAATYMRGIAYIQIPTTLLAQVDSSVGGKTGIDLKSGKNMVGAFHQPSLVVADSQFLKTLPKRELRCGLSEVIKYGILWDANFFRYLEKNIGKILSLDHNALTQIIARSCEIKAEIVAQDEKESGIRALLNLGHTLGHAIETISGYSKFLHGEAVSIGMVFAAHLSFKNGWCQSEDGVRITSLLKKAGLPVKWPVFKSKVYEKVLLSDKKASDDTISYVAIKKIGKTFLTPLKAGEVTQHLS